MVKVKIDVHSNVHVLEDLHKFQKGLLEETSKMGKDTLQENTPKDTSEAANSYTVEKSDNTHVITNDKEYLPWVNDGTGIYGPLRRRITPVHANVLHFHWKGQEWFLKSVRGQKPQKFVDVSMNEIVQNIPQAVMIASSKYLK